ncbi:DUF1648 domain-containing protein [Halapricum hydrolyticum]|uniref:DUF1648 domain-containing protein n=1 Tax=Halapricum hydrolyticum TaxID=2979991 RepID=A0AAE3IAE0_9EURY|nr:DUF1648 domain-containing protein [Halapricum hydrolyticum]MCU4718445.1 DUF1648 domain-containing protein [Halapricum hydrolyticum]MCU4726442.1 DUF1648 domain-containing protein [Halapricum hydrolyticum]
MTLHRSDRIAGGLLIVTALVGIAFWDALPAEMAIHFGPGGTPDSYVPKPVGVVLAPMIGVGAIAVARTAIRADPTADPRVGAGAIYFVGGVVSYVHALVLAYNLGHRFSMTAALVPVFLAAAVLVAWAVYRDRIAS